MRKRTKARERALQLLYQIDVRKDAGADDISLFWEHYSDRMSPEARTFAERIVRGVNDNKAKLDKVIADNAKNWNIKRMAVVDRNVLRLAIYELYYEEDIPPKLSINEAIDLAKKFGDKDSGKFVNGILDKVNKILAKSS